MVHKVLGGLAATLAYSGVGLAHPIHRHLTNLTAAQADSQITATDWTPQFLDADQNQTLVAVAELIVPGSEKAQVNRIIDLLLTVDTSENQQKLMASLSSLDRESQKMFHQPFKNTTSTQQQEILTMFSTATKGSDDEAADDLDEMPPPRPLLTLHDHFQNLKGWVVGTYYSTEQGMRELGWTEEVFFENFPGCSHPEGHH